MNCSDVASLTETFRWVSGEKQLFLSLNKPHNLMSKDTTAKWIRQLWSLSGIDVTILRPIQYGQHLYPQSNFYVPTQDILKRADCTQEQTFQQSFQQYCNKTVEIMTPYDEAVSMCS